MMTAQETAELMRLLQKFKKEINKREDIQESNKKMYIMEIVEVEVTRRLLGV